MSDQSHVSTVRRTLPTEANGERGYVAAWNMQTEEFPIETVVQSTNETVLPVVTVLPQNGLQPMSVPLTSVSNWNWTRVVIEKPSSFQVPLVIDSLMLKANEFEPPVGTSTQYIRVVIRNFTLPQGEKPKD